MTLEGFFSPFNPWGHAPIIPKNQKAYDANFVWKRKKSNRKFLDEINVGQLGIEPRLNGL